MPRAGDIDHIEVVLLDDPVQVDVDEVLPRGRAPVPEQHVLHIGERQRPLQKRIVTEVDLPHREVVGCPPIRVDPAQQLGGECLGRWFHDSFSFIAPPTRRRRK